MPESSALDVAYDSVADRLKLVLRDESSAIGLLLTRQFVKAFLQRFTDTLEKSVPGADSDPRAAVIFEHLEALEAGSADRTERDRDVSGASGAAGAGGQAKRSWPTDEAFTLAVQINVQAHGDRFVITLQDASEHRHRFGLSRAESHRILSAVARKAQAAGWDLEPYMGWLDEAGSARTHLAGARTSH